MNNRINMQKNTIYYLFIFLITIGCAQNSAQELGEKVKKEIIDVRVDSVLQLMTLNEKIGQLNQYSVGAELTGPGSKDDWQSERIGRLKNGQVGSVLNLLGAEETRKMQEMVVNNSRLGIPLLFSYDVVHGYKTIFPIPLGESASWDLEAIQKSAAIAAAEASAAGLHWTFAPMVDISRDARWGRVMEGAGEDTYLGSEIAKARINGFQGNDLSDYSTIAACAKHFAAYGFVESGKDYNNVYVGKSMLLNTILPPFKAANDAGVVTFMNAFNDIDGIPSTANSYLLKDILKDEWGFKGFVVSDWNSIGEMINHGTAKDKSDATVKAINAGTDMDMEAVAYIENLESLVESGKVKEETINEAVSRILKVKFQLGLFDDPYSYSDVEREKATVMSDQNMEAARDVARKSVVLLKNESNVLPLSTNTKIAVIGPLVKDKDTPLGNWRGAVEAGTAISLWEGLSEVYDSKNLVYAEGCKLSVGPNNFFNEVEVEEKDRSGFTDAVNAARNAEVVIMTLGETAYMSGEARSRADIGLPGLQLELLKEIYKVNKNIVLVLMNGRPLTIPWEAENIPAILETWHLGSQAGRAITDVLTGKYNPSGKLPMTFPRSVGQLPMYYNHKSTGRPSADSGMVFYTHHYDVENTPLFPFGFGLSYSQFEYANLKLNKNSIGESETLEVTIEVTNTSNLAGEEVVQLYLQDVVASITRPVKELKKFNKVKIEPNETKEVVFNISKEDLAFYRADFSYGTEPGEFKVFVGGNSRDVLETKFMLTENQQ